MSNVFTTIRRLCLSFSSPRILTCRALCRSLVSGNCYNGEWAEPRMNFYLRDKGADLEKQPSALPSSQHRSSRHGVFLAKSSRLVIKRSLYIYSLKRKLNSTGKHLSKDPVSWMQRCRNFLFFKKKITAASSAGCYSLIMFFPLATSIRRNWFCSRLVWASFAFFFLKLNCTTQLYLQSMFRTNIDVMDPFLMLWLKLNSSLCSFKGKKRFHVLGKKKKKKHIILSFSCSRIANTNGSSIVTRLHSPLQWIRTSWEQNANLFWDSCNYHL